MSDSKESMEKVIGQLQNTVTELKGEECTLLGNLYKCQQSIPKKISKIWKLLLGKSVQSACQRYRKRMFLKMVSMNCTMKTKNYKKKFMNLKKKHCSGWRDCFFEAGEQQEGKREDSNEGRSVSNETPITTNSTGASVISRCHI